MVSSQISERAEDQLHTIIRTELAEQTSHVTAYRVDRNPRGAGDLLVSHATQNASEDLGLARGQTEILFEACPVLFREQLSVPGYCHPASTHQK